MSHTDLLLEVKRLRYAVERRAPVRSIFVVGMIEAITVAVVWIPLLLLASWLYRQG